jgi:hypothetical protein
MNSYFICLALFLYGGFSSVAICGEARRVHVDISLQKKMKETKINLNFKEVKVKDAFASISAQGGILITYDVRLLSTHEAHHPTR